MLFVCGGAHPDRRGRIAGPYRPGASNPGSMREEIGGGAFNAARAAMQRGVKVSFLSARGGDFAGESVAAAIARSGAADLSGTFLDRSTPSYTSLIDSSGEQIAGLADMELYELAFPRLMRRRPVRLAAGSATGILCDANLPGSAIAALVALAVGKPLFAMAVSPAKAVRWLPFLPRLDCLFMNAAEARALAGHDGSPADCAGKLAAAGLARAVITDGPRPPVLLDHGAVTSPFALPAVTVADVTGAGDTLAGACTAALVRGAPFCDAVAEGLAAAVIAVQCPDCAPELPPDRMDQIIAQIRETPS